MSHKKEGEIRTHPGGVDLSVCAIDASKNDCKLQHSKLASHIAS